MLQSSSIATTLLLLLLAALCTPQTVTPSPEPLPSVYYGTNDPPASVTFDLYSNDASPNDGGFLETPESQLTTLISNYLAISAQSVIVTRYTAESTTITICEGDVISFINAVNQEDTYFNGTLLWKAVNTGVLWAVPCSVPQTYSYFVSFESLTSSSNITLSGTTLHIYVNNFDSSDSFSLHSHYFSSFLLLFFLFFLQFI